MEPLLLNDYSAEQPAGFWEDGMNSWINFSKLCSSSPEGWSLLDGTQDPMLLCSAAQGDPASGYNQVARFQLASAHFQTKVVWAWFYGQGKGRGPLFGL